MTADQIWRAALRRNHETPYAIGERYADLLVTLLTKGPDHGSALMRRTGDTHQPNTVRRLQRLDSLGFVISKAVVLTVPRAGSTTTSKALEWRLTGRGRELATALRDEARMATRALRTGGEYWPTDAGLAAVRGRGPSLLPAARVHNSERRFWPVAA